MLENRIHLALVHYPVYDKTGKIVATALTSTDLHDLARLAKTYCLGGAWIVTPLESQRKLAFRMMEHWLSGPGREFNPTRVEALGKAKVVSQLTDVVKALTGSDGKPPGIIATSAKETAGALSPEEVRDRMKKDPRQWVILLGTGWGLEKGLTDSADMILAPIRAGSSFNHLSVRCAAAVIVDRLVGEGIQENPCP